MPPPSHDLAELVGLHLMFLYEAAQLALRDVRWE